MPPRAVGPARSNYHGLNFGGLSWAVLTLPYVEGQSASDAISSAVKAATAATPPGPLTAWTATTNPADTHALFARITPGNAQSFEFQGFLCPSGPRSTQIQANTIAGVTPAIAANGVLGRLSYKACVGGNSLGLAGTANNAVNNARNENCDGAFSYLRGANFADMTDGTSNVVVIGEVAMMYTQQTKFIGSVSFGAIVNNANDPCTGRYNPTTKVTNTPFTGTAGGIQSTSWSSGHTLHSSFATCYPPNGPSCTHSTIVANAQNNVNGASVISASSYHPGGCQAALGDGSVRFWSETIDALTWRRIGDKADGQPVQIDQ
jgi:hypothetical protein